MITKRDSKFLLILLCFCFVLFSCVTQNNLSEKDLDSGKSTKIAVASDLHFFAPELLINRGAAFSKYTATDRKMLEESKAIIQKLVADLLLEKPDVFLISGDLTKDGELASHQGLVKELEPLRAAGVKIYVVPGNHDINNPDGVIFDGDNTSPAKQVNEVEFKEIYKNYGYNESEMIAKGPDLCYVSEIAEDLWLIGIDCCEYKENYALNTPVTGGSIDAQKLKWILEMTKKAKDAGKHVVGMMHHGIVEHFPGQRDIAPEYLIKDWDEISTKFAEEGLNIVFTGHFHAQDIAKKTVGNNFIFDIQTGASVTFPSPYRIIQMKGDVLDIKTKRLEGVIHENIKKGDSFQKHAKEYLEANFPALFKGILEEYGDRLPIKNELMLYLPVITPVLGEFLLNHLQGDEKGLVKTAAVYEMIKTNVPEEYKQHICSVDAALVDTAPADNDIIIDMKTGKTK